MGPPEERAGLVVRLVEGHGVQEAGARGRIVARLVEYPALPEQGLGLHAPPEVAERALGRRQSRQDEEEQRYERRAGPRAPARVGVHRIAPGGPPLPPRPRGPAERGPWPAGQPASQRCAPRDPSGWPPPGRPGPPRRRSGRRARPRLQRPRRPRRRRRHVGRSSARRPADPLRGRPGWPSARHPGRRRPQSPPRLARQGHRDRCQDPVRACQVLGRRRPSKILGRGPTTRRWRPGPVPPPCPDGPLRSPRSGPPRPERPRDPCPPSSAPAESCPPGPDPRPEPSTAALARTATFRATAGRVGASTALALSRRPSRNPRLPTRRRPCPNRRLSPSPHLPSRRPCPSPRLPSRRPCPSPRRPSRRPCPSLHPEPPPFPPEPPDPEPPPLSAIAVPMPLCVGDWSQGRVVSAQEEGDGSRHSQQPAEMALHGHSLRGRRIVMVGLTDLSNQRAYREPAGWARPAASGRRSHEPLWAVGLPAEGDSPLGGEMPATPAPGRAPGGTSRSGTAGSPGSGRAARRPARDSIRRAGAPAR